jgi:predicted transcriptional regulator YheO
VLKDNGEDSQSRNSNLALENRMVSAEKVMALLEQHLGATSEIVFHDLTKPYEHTIIDIRHGEITGREVGGCGSNLGLEVIRGLKKDGDCFNYITHTKSGRVLRSSTIYLYDQDKIVGAICINTDISDSLRLENMLRTYNGYIVDDTEKAENREHFAQNVVDLLDFFIKDAQEFVGVQAPLMNREEKKKFLSYLDKKGAFLITKSGEHVCKFLGISKYTLYNFLEAIRNEGTIDNTKFENIK